MKFRVRSVATTLLATVLSLGVVSCTPGDPEGPAVPSIDPSPSQIKPVDGPWPLTGIRGPVVDRPVVSVKIENSGDARPQKGLDEADIVFEQIVEGGITRLMALYHSQIPTEIYPIRSARPMDGPIIAPFGGVFVCSGGQWPMLNRVTDLGVQLLSMDGGDHGFWRISSRWAPHNVAGDVQEFLDQAYEGHTDPPAPMFNYADAADTNSATLFGVPATALYANMSGSFHPNWAWDAQTKSWLRFEWGDPFVNVDDWQLHAKNVIALNVDVGSTGYSDPAGNPVPETIVVGSGTGVYMADGHSVAITWEKPNELTQFVFRDPSGNPIDVVPGNTWIELVPTSSGSIEVVYE
ncbi:MAG: DUF3048 domain-containing protein [Propionibacteriaceae bacterium]|jgi:hypothetical protein|nr:DUF3048 domain-containing protein [Propionibacteriaceae bacterium]